MKQNIYRKHALVLILASRETNFKPHFLITVKKLKTSIHCYSLSLNLSHLYFCTVLKPSPYRDVYKIAVLISDFPVSNTLNSFSRLWSI